MKENRRAAAVLRVSTKYNVAEQHLEKANKHNDYSPLRKSPLRHSVTAEDIPSSKSSSASDSNTDIEDLHSKPVRLSTVGTPALRFPSPTRTNVAEKNSLIFRKSPQRLRDSKNRTTSLPPPSFELATSSSPQRPFNLKKRASSESKSSIRSSRSRSSLSDDTHVSVCDGTMEASSSLIPMKYKSHFTNRPMSSRSSVSVSLKDTSLIEPNNMDTPSNDNKDKSNNSKIFEDVDSRDKIQKIRSEFNRISQNSSSLVKSISNDEMMQMLLKQKEDIESLQQNVAQILLNQEKIIQKLGISFHQL